MFPATTPGVMLSGGARRLIGLYAVRPGSRAVVATVDDRGIDAALALLDAGVEVACVADLRPEGSIERAGLLEKGVELESGATVLEARGRSRLEGVVLGPPGAEDGDGRTVGCDLLVVSGGTSPATSLITQAGGRTAYDSGRGHFALSEASRRPPSGRRGRRERRARAAELSGQVAGAEAAHSLGLGDADSRRREAEDRDALTGLTAEPQATRQCRRPSRASGRASASRVSART